MPFITGTAAGESITGSADDDSISGDAGADTILGGDGNDVLCSAGYAPPPWEYNAPPWVPPLDTGDERDSISGGAGSDVIYAGWGDTVDGGSDGDNLFGDSLFISFAAATHGVEADFRPLATGAVVSIDGGVISGIESIGWLEGSNYDDLLVPIGEPYGNGPIYGLGGNDHIIAGAFTTFIDGGDGNDLIDNTQSNYGGDVHGGAGDDTIVGGGGFEDIDGGDGNDSITGSQEFDIVQGGAGNDWIDGGSFTDTLHGGDGDDTLYGAGDEDSLDGGAGNDHLYGDFSIFGTVNRLSSETNADTLSGGDGSDTLQGDAGDDLLDGGAGSDTAVYSGAFADYFFVYDNTAGEFQVSDLVAGRDGTDTVTGVEFFAFADGVRSADSIAAMFGTAGADRHDGSALDDTFFGLAGNDTISGGAGNDTISGGAGNDVLDGGDGADALDYFDQHVPVSVSLAITTAQDTGGAGIDTVTNFENLIGGWASDFLAGDAHANLISAGEGNDTLDGGGGADTLAGGPGDDTYVIRSGLETVIELAQQGTDTAQSYRSYVLPDDVENLALLGTSAVDGVGNASDNAITGNGASNLLRGLDGNDVLRGGGGFDTLDGGSGDDTLFASYGDAVDGGANGPLGDTLSISFKSAPTGVVADFRPLSTGGSVTVDGASITGIEHIAKIEGSDHDDMLAPMDEVTTGMVIDAGAGLDHVRFSGNLASYVLITGPGYAGVATATGGFSVYDSLVNVERVDFDNFTVAFDIDGNAGKAYRLYQAAFDRKPDLGGLGYQINDLDHVYTLEQVASNFIASPEFQRTYGNVDNTQFLTLLYDNVLHRAPDTGGLQFHLDEFAHGETRAQMLIHFSESPENQANVIGDIQDGIVYVPVG